MKTLLSFLFLFLILSSFSLSQDIYLSERNIRNFTVSLDSKLIAYIHYEAGWKGWINLYDIEKRTIIKKIESNTIEYNSSLSFSPDNKLLAWNNYGAINFYEISSGDIKSIKINCSNFTFSPVNNLIVTCINNGNSDATISLIDSKSLFVLKDIKCSFQRWYESISYDGNIVSTYGEEGKINHISFFPKSKYCYYKFKKRVY